MMDELRDYRFYAEDMIHPSKLAINYIWEKFQHVWIYEESQVNMDEVEAIQNGLHIDLLIQILKPSKISSTIGKKKRRTSSSISFYDIF